MTFPAYIAAKGAQKPVGVGLKSQHYDDVLTSKPALAFFEVHAENYMMPGGAHHRYLEEIRETYPLSIHGVGMSLGSAEGLNRKHLQRFSEVVNRYRPWLVSEHLAWSRAGDTYLNDLLPVPMTQESLRIVTGNVKALQDAIGRKILIENPSSYLTFADDEMPEVDFLVALAEATGCGLLLDVNNVYVSGKNIGWDVRAYLDSIPADLVGEIHLAGHLTRDVEGQTLRIDDHGSRVSDSVWTLYERVIARIGPRPTLIEWDSNIPTLDVLVVEAEKAQKLMSEMVEPGQAATRG
ncbi:MULTISPECIES: DUF692 domain-containing protein [Kordiimonas]|jgi:hypothetical protein|uniref:MNIO family bufferin maturase n=1 Tax=Kordiimonas TaxID=288021 RepID=UPI00257C930B|nr:DUF692 domain-containing protein [Kordiimonas sp. UBA4487]